MRRRRGKGARLVDAELQRAAAQVEFDRHAIVDAAPDLRLRPVGVDEIERRREVGKVRFRGRQRHFRAHPQLVGHLPVAAEVEHPALGDARAGVARRAHIRVDHRSGGAADAERARDRRVDAAKVDRTVGSVERAPVDRFERCIVGRIDDRRRRGSRNLHPVALLPARLVVERRVEIEFQIVIGLPFERGGAVVGFIFVILQPLLKELDAQEGKGLGARSRAGEDDRVAVDARLERSDVLPCIAPAHHDADFADAGVPAVAERGGQAREGRFGQVTVFDLCPRRNERLAQVERADRPQIDRPADRSLDRLRGRDLGDLDRGDQRRGQILEADTRSPGARPDGRHAVDFGAVGVGAANLHRIADPGLPGDLNAGDILQHFGQILVGQFADIFGLDDLDDIVGGALFAQRGGKGAADARDDDRVIARRIGGGIGRRRILRERGSGGDRHRRRAQQNRREIHLAARNAPEAAPNHPTLPDRLCLGRGSSCRTNMSTHDSYHNRVDIVLPLV